MVDKKCNMCGAAMEEKSVMKVAGSTYYRLVCKKCHHSVARRE